MLARCATKITTALLCTAVYGCACIDSCKLPPRAFATSATVNSANAPHMANRALLVPIEAIHSQSVIPGIGDIAIGTIISELRVLIGDLSNLVQTTSGEMKSIIIQTQASASQLAAELDQRFKDRTTLLVKQLGDLEQQTANDAAVAINSMQAAVNTAKQAADDSALTAMQEASIATYDALFDLPCRDRVPRIVYATPRQARIWSDLPGEGGNNRTLEFKLRGNYVDSFGQPKVSAKGQSVKVIASNNNELYLDLPPPVISDMQAIQYPTYLVFNVELQTCGGKQQMQDVAVLIKPPLTYTVFARIAPTVTIPFQGRQHYVFSETGGCDSNYRVDKLWPAGPPGKGTLLTWNVDVKDANCGSNVVAIYPQGGNLKVDATIHGCGKDCFLGVCNCRGRGWLSYVADIDYIEMRPAALSVYEPPPATSAQLTYAFPYKPGLPESRDPSLTICDYYVRASVNEGSSSKIVELTNSIPQAPGFVSRVNPNTCEVSVQVDQPTYRSLATVKGGKQ